MQKQYLRIWATAALAIAAVISARPTLAEDARGAFHRVASPLAGKDVISYAILRGTGGRPTLLPGGAPAFELCGAESIAPSDGSGKQPLHQIKCAWEPPTPPQQQPAPEPQTPPPQTGSSETPPAPVPGTPQQPETPPPEQAADAGFRYHPPGDLAVRDAKRGRPSDRRIYLPGIKFPMHLDGTRQAHMNSQIWGYGGGGYNNVGAAGGTECDPRNYNPLEQRDNFCEVRGWSMPLCPSGVGHQGQDIRPATCKDNTWEVMAVVDGIITFVSSNTTVKLKGADGTVYEYLHMHPSSIKVKEGDKVKQGDMLGRVSKYMNGTRSTTYHLHFNARQRIKVGTKVLEAYVPVYASLIAAYREAKGLGPSVDADGNLVVDARYEIGAVAQLPPQPSPQPAPEPTPSPQPAPEPTPAPAPTPPTPAPEPAPTPAPSPAPAPEPTPAPAPQPEPVPAPQPQPPAPTPTPEPAPAPAPTPTPTPEPAPAPTPAPAPAPEPAPAPAPEPAPAPQPAPTPPQPEPQKSWWQRTTDTVLDYWNRLWKK